MEKLTYEQKVSAKKGKVGSGSENIIKFGDMMKTMYQKQLRDRKEKIEDLEKNISEMEEEKIKDIKDINESIEEFIYLVDAEDVKTVDKRNSLAIKFTEEISKKIVSSERIEKDFTSKKEKSEKEISTLRDQVSLIEKMINYFS